MSEVTKDQFKWNDKELTHTPTGARFTMKSQFCNLGVAGDLLPDGNCYEKNDVLSLANKLMCETHIK